MNPKMKRFDGLKLHIHFFVSCGLIFLLLFSNGCNSDMDIADKDADTKKLSGDGKNGTKTSAENISEDINLSMDATNAADLQITANESNANISNLTGPEKNTTKKTGKQIELERYKKYSTLIDLTTLTSDNCSTVKNNLYTDRDQHSRAIKSLEEKLTRRFNERKEAELDLLDAQQKEDNEPTDANKRYVERKKEDLMDAEGKYDEVNAQLAEEKRQFNTISTSIRIVDDECTKIEKNEEMRSSVRR